MTISINPTLSTAETVKTESSSSSKESSALESWKSEKVRETIEKFEGLFMSMMMKQLRETGTGEGLFPGDKSDTYGGLFDTMMGDYIAKSSETGLENLFTSSAAMKQLEAYISPKVPGEQRSKGIEEYRNEQFRSSAVAVPSAT